MTTQKFVTLSRNLPGFVEPDTHSETEGRVPAGAYEVLEVLPNQGAPNQDDYARIAIETLAGDDTWICTRSGTQRYGEFVEVDREPAPRDDPTDDPNAIPERAMVSRLADFRDYRYTLTGARYPFDIDGCGLPKAPPKKNNCCTFVEALVVRAWQDVHADRFTWTPARHRQMMIIGDDLFSPINCLVEAGIANAFDGDETASPPPWSAVQGWRSSGGGHTFLIVDHHTPSDRVLTLESNRGFGLDGVGFRRLGNIRDHADNGPPAKWWEDPRAPTWADICATYPDRKLAALKVSGRSWSDIDTLRGATRKIETDTQSEKESIMPWPNKLAYKITAQFFSMEYGESARRLLLEDLLVKELVFFNPSATPESQKITGFRVAGELLRHMEELSIELEEEGDLSTAMETLAAILADGDAPSEEIGKVIDIHFSFIDE
jgi:hypothetical protein